MKPVLESPLDIRTQKEQRDLSEANKPSYTLNTDTGTLVHGARQTNTPSYALNTYNGAPVLAARPTLLHTP